MSEPSWEIRIREDSDGTRWAWLNGGQWLRSDALRRFSIVVDQVADVVNEDEEIG